MAGWVVRDEELDLATGRVRTYEREENGRPERVREYARSQLPGAHQPDQWIPHPDWEKGQAEWIAKGEAAWKADEARHEAENKADDAADRGSGASSDDSARAAGDAEKGSGKDAEGTPGIVGEGTLYERPEHGYVAPDHARLVREKGTYKDPADHPFFVKNNLSAANIVHAYDHTTEAEKHQGRRWYPDGARLAWALGGGNTKLGASVLSGYSPRSGWPLNIYNAARALAMGRPLKPGEGTFMDATHTPAVTRAFAGKDFDETFTAPKTNAFARLLTLGRDHPDDDLGQVVVDAHALSVAAGRRLLKDEVSGKGENASPIGSDPYYSHVADMYRDAARTISERDGEEISPSEVQAVTWLRQQRMNAAEEKAAFDAGVKGAGGAMGLQTSMKNNWTRWEKYAREHGIATELGTTALPPVPITAAEARGNSRLVSAAEFHEVASRGRQLLNKMESDTSPPDGLVSNWAQLSASAFEEVQKPWGGVTIDSHTGEALDPSADAYALSVKPAGMGTVSVPEGATRAQFDKAMDQALVRFASLLEQGGYYLGVFHDDDNHRIDIDPVVVVDNQSDAEAIGAYTTNIGGAYRFSDGNGYFPPHIQG